MYICVTPPTWIRTNSPSGSRTRDSGAGGGRSNKERQRLQPLERLIWGQESEVYTQPLLAYIRYTHPPKPHSHPGHGTNVTPPTRVHTHSPSGSWTQGSGAGGGRSNKERQRLQPLAAQSLERLFWGKGNEVYTQPLLTYIRYICIAALTYRKLLG